MPAMSKIRTVYLQTFTTDVHFVGVAVCTFVVISVLCSVHGSL